MCTIISSQVELLGGTRFKLADALFRDAKLLCYLGERTPGPSLSKNVALSRCNKMSFHMGHATGWRGHVQTGSLCGNQQQRQSQNADLAAKRAPALVSIWCLLLADSI